MMQSKDSSATRPLVRRLAAIGGLVIGTALLVAVATFLFLPAQYLDGYLNRRIVRALEEEAFPAYSVRMSGLHYAVWENRLECDSVRILKSDSAASLSISKFSLTGIARMRLLLHGHLEPDHIASSHLEAQDVVLTFVHSQYELRCARVRLSVPDSLLVIELAEFKPPMNDEQFFAGSKYRNTLFHIVIPECRVTGLAGLGLMQGTDYRARTAHFSDASIFILINKDKPSDYAAPPPLMPNEMLSSIKESLRIDSIRITNGRLMYNERFGAGADPAVLTCDNLQIVASGIGNRAAPGDTAVLLAEGAFMHGGMMTLQMTMPLADSGLTYRYSGALSRTNASVFNSFIEKSDRKRLKTGILHSASFDISVTKGRAIGSTRLAYEDIKIVAINPETGSESGIGNTFISFFANNIKLRTSNLPDKAGAMKIGTVNYARKKDEAIMEFTWLALRSGICDVVGF
jgi:hypothetical protein